MNSDVVASTTSALLSHEKLTFDSTPNVCAAESPRISLTIYYNDLALVQEIRPINLTTGRNKLEFTGASASIRPETVSLFAPGISIVEQNFDFND